MKINSQVPDLSFCRIYIKKHQTKVPATASGFYASPIDQNAGSECCIYPMVKSVDPTSHPRLMEIAETSVSQSNQTPLRFLLLLKKTEIHTAGCLSPDWETA